MTAVQRSDRVTPRPSAQLLSKANAYGSVGGFSAFHVLGVPSVRELSGVLAAARPAPRRRSRGTPSDTNPGLDLHVRLQ